MRPLNRWLFIVMIGAAAMASCADEGDSVDDNSAVEDAAAHGHGVEGWVETLGKEDATGITALDNASIIVIESRYARIAYLDEDDLEEFNDELWLNSRMRREAGSHDTLEAEVAAKIDLIFERVEVALDMFPPAHKFSFMIHPSKRAVQADFRAMYGVDVDYLAFYSPSRDAVFVSANDTNLDVVSHEIGHVIVERYFTESPPSKIHELLAQFASKHVAD